MHAPKALTLLTLAFSLQLLAAEKPVFLWLDAHANFARLGTKDSIVRVLDKAESVGITAVIIDLRGIDGYVLYPSRIAPVLKEYEGFKRADNFDYVGTMLSEARRRGLKAYLSMNTFSEGDKRNKKGIAYEKHPEWQVKVYSKDGIVPIGESKEGIAAFVNPILPEVREYECSLWEEVLHMYKADGIVLDRARYSSIASDFSDASRKAFEKYIGKPVKRWPYDIYTLCVLADGKVKQDRGPHFRKWLEWRAQVIYNFFAEIRARVKKSDSTLAFTDYVGAWYPIYYDMGVNWASPKYHPEKEYDWATPTYYKTGYAPLLDFLFVGTYFYDVTKGEAIKSHTPVPDEGKKPADYWWYSVDGSAEIAMKVTKGALPVYGSLYVQQYKDKKDPQQFIRAMKADLKLTNGLMIFDLVHLDTDDWWQYVKQALKR